MFRSVNRRLRAIIVFVASMLLLAACSSSGYPTSYDDQPNAEGVSNVEQNWTEACTVKVTELAAGEANTVCGCSYSAIKSEIPFEDFVEMDDRLRGDVTSLLVSANDATSTEARVSQLIADCIANS